MSLVESVNHDRVEPLSLVESPSLNTIVVDTDLLVRVTDGDVEGEIVLEVIVACDIELGQFSIGDVEVDTVRTEDEPEDEDGETHSENN